MQPGTIVRQRRHGSGQVSATNLLALAVANGGRFATSDASNVAAAVLGAGVRRLVVVRAAPPCPIPAAGSRPAERGVGRGKSHGWQARTPPGGIYRPGSSPNGDIHWENVMKRR